MVFVPFAVVSSILTVALAYTWPSPQYDALERFLYEGLDVKDSSIATLTSGCVKRATDGPEHQKSTIAAEWLRLAYHDMATHNVTDGSGGLDASIRFELTRPENIGAGNSHSVGDFRDSASKYISHADIIAMGAVWAVASCGGPSIPYRGGRRDAAGPGRTGVPEPQQDLASHTESFRLQGFTPTEMVSLVACGHTLGGVRSVDFPSIIPDKTGFNLSTFDTTDKYDHAIISEYLDSSTKNPLIQVANTTFASDLRIFSSDGNVTMKSLNSESAYSQTCTTLLARMLNTVPSDVTLTEEIKLLPAKVSDAQITVLKSQLIFSTMLRLTHPANAPAPTNRQVKLFWCDKRNEFKDCAKITNVASSPAVNRQGPPFTSPLTDSQNIIFFNYHFSVPISANRSVSKFWFQVKEGDGSAPVIYDNEGQGYIFPQDEIIYVLSLSSGGVLPSGNGSLQSYDFVAGIRNGTNFTRAQIHALDYTFQESRSLANFTVDLQHNTTKFLVDGYDYYSGHVQTPGLALTVDIEVVIGGISFVIDYLSAADVRTPSSLQQPLSIIGNITTTSSSAAPGPTSRSPSSALLLLLPPPSTYLALLGILVSFILSLNH